MTLGALSLAQGSRWSAVTLAGPSIARFAHARSGANCVVHVYVLDVDTLADHFNELATTLDARERSETARLTDRRRRDRMTAARGALRQVLGAHLGQAAQAVPIERDANGRLRLIRASGRPDLRLSCSRSGPYSVFAVSTGHDVGIDIEAADAARFDADVAALMLSRREQAIHDRLDPTSRARWLARVWASKEAILKGMGCGLRVSPELLDVATKLASPALHVRPGTASAVWQAANMPDAWCVATLNWQDRIIAVAERGNRPHLRCAQLVPHSARRPGTMTRC